jgi:6-phosphogluconolactonase
MKLALAALVGTLLPLAMSAHADTPQKETPYTLVYIGTYTGTQSRGIYVGRLDEMTGEISRLTLAAETQNPSFLAIHPNHRFLYATNESGQFAGHSGGEVTAYAIDPVTGKLREINHRASEGSNPCFISIDKTGKTAAIANYGGGLVTYAIRTDGSLSEPLSKITPKGSSINPGRQKEPHSHSINFDASGHHAVAADLGIDKLLSFKVEHGNLVANDPAYNVVTPGSGPRHFTFSPDGKFGYLLNELSCTVTVFQYDAARGQLQEVQTVSALPPTEVLHPAYSGAEIQVHPSGHFAYASIRGLNIITVFEVNGDTGQLTPRQYVATGGKTPRNFRLSPNGRLLLAANQDSDTIVAFHVDPRTGELTPTGKQTQVAKPVCIKFLTVERQ